MKDVADGYAINYLLPRRLAVEATTGALRVIEQEKGAAKAKAERDRAELSALAKRIEGLELTFSLKAGTQGKVFGSVTNRDLAQALSARGIAIDRGKIHLADPLRTLGTHRVEVRLLPDLRAELRVEIQAAR